MGHPQVRGIVRTWGAALRRPYNVRLLSRQGRDLGGGVAQGLVY